MLWADISLWTTIGITVFLPINLAEEDVGWIWKRIVLPSVWYFLITNPEGLVRMSGSWIKLKIEICGDPWRNNFSIQHAMPNLYRITWKAYGSPHVHFNPQLVDIFNCLFAIYVCCLYSRSSKWLWNGTPFISSPQEKSVRKIRWDSSVNFHG